MEIEEQARSALQHVFSGDQSRLAEFYSPDFVDHVNRMEFRGHDGIALSTALPRRLLAGLDIEIALQASSADLVACQWVLRGTNRGRTVRLTGVSFLRFADGLIVESWDTADSLETFRQLGARRSIIALIRERRLFLAYRRAEKAATS